MTTLPNTRNDDIDEFEIALSNALGQATPQEMVDGVRRACEMIEKMAEDAGLDMDRINNATSTCCRVTLRLAAQIERATREN